MREVFVSIGLAVLRGMVQTAWDGFWATVFEAVEMAEKKWKDQVRGEVKKAWVVDYVYEWLDSKKLVKWYNKRFVLIAVRSIVDHILADLNKQLGHNWSSKVSDLRSHLANKIPFIN
jgi:hypothetical protein